MTAPTLQISKIEDREDSGECGACGRTNLRWIAILSDGTGVGMECAKKILGYRPATKSFDWIAHFTPVAEHVEYGTTYVMWQRKCGNETRETQDGVLMVVGGVRNDWTKKGWL